MAQTRLRDPGHITHLQHQRRDQRDQIGVPQRSPRPLSVPCTCRAPARTAARELATAFSVSLWAWMPRWSAGNVLRDPRDDARDLVRQGAAVGVAEHDPAGARPPGGTGRRALVRVGLKPSKKCSASNITSGTRRTRRRRYRRSCAGSRRARRRAPRRLKSPSSCRPGDRAGSRMEQRHKAGIVGRAAAGRRVMPKAKSGARQGRRVPRRNHRRSDWRPASRPRHSRSRADRALGNRHLVGNAKSTPGSAAVAQRGVEEIEPLGHGRAWSHGAWAYGRAPAHAGRALADAGRRGPWLRAYDRVLSTKSCKGTRLRKRALPHKSYSPRVHGCPYARRTQVNPQEPAYTCKGPLLSPGGR